MNFDYRRVIRIARIRAMIASKETANDRVRHGCRAFRQTIECTILAPVKIAKMGTAMLAWPPSRT